MKIFYCDKCGRSQNDTRLYHTYLRVSSTEFRKDFCLDCISTLINLEELKSRGVVRDEQDQ